MNVFKKFFQEHYHEVKPIETDQDRRSVVPDSGLYCLQRLSADNQTLLLARKELCIFMHYYLFSWPKCDITIHIHMHIITHLVT